MKKYFVSKQILKIAKNFIAFRKIQKDFQKQLQEAIKSNQTITFDYVNKQGKHSLVQLTPTKIQKKWGQTVVTGITKYGKEFSYLLDSIGKSDEEKTVVLDDNCDFKKQLQKAIREGYKVQFSYFMKNGNRVKITMKPKQIVVKSGLQICIGDTTSGQRNYYISSMGDNTMDEQEMYRQYPFLKDKVFYCIIKRKIFYFKPTGINKDKVVSDNLELIQKTKSYVSGDVEDGRDYMEWQITIHKVYPGKPIGRQILELKNDKLYYKGNELLPIKVGRHLEYQTSKRVRNQRSYYGFNKKIKENFIRLSKELVAEIDQPYNDVNKVEQMWNDIEKVSKILRDVNKNIQMYKNSFQSSRYKTYEDFKKIMKKNLSEVKEYCDYVSDKISKVSNKL